MSCKMVRNTQIDSLKFFLIFLVLVGHCLDINIGAKGNSVVFKFIYSFHMPVFAMLSGFVFRQKDYREYLGGGNLIATYLIFQLLYGGKVLTYKGGSLGDFWLDGFIYNAKHLYDPADGLWYLLSLYFWRIFLNSTPSRLRDTPLLHFCLTLFVSFVAGFIPLGREMSFQRTFAFYPLFVLGFYLKDTYEQLRKTPRAIPLAVILIYMAVIACTSIPAVRMLLQRTDYDLSNILYSIMGRGMFYFWTIPISLSVMAIFPDLRFFSSEGRETMFYYLYHMFFVLLFRYIVISTGMECNIATVIVFAITSFGVMKLLINVKALDFLTKPITF